MWIDEEEKAFGTMGRSVDGTYHFVFFTFFFSSLFPVYSKRTEDVPTS